MLVAGWVGNVDQWILWEQGWKQVLSDYKIQSGVFHMTDFEAAQWGRDADNEFAHLATSERQRFRSRLINHIATRCRHCFCTMVPMHDYKEVNEMYYLEEWLGKPYSIAALGLVQKLKAWKDQWEPDSPLEVFFEDGTKHKGDLIKVFRQFGYEEPIFREKKKVTPLQAADMLAWENFNQFKTGIVRAPFMELCAHTRGSSQFGMFTTPRLIEACEGVTQIPKRDATKVRAFCYNAEPKVARARKILGQPRPGQVKGTERRATDKTMLRFLLGVDDISDLVKKS